MLYQNIGEIEVICNFNKYGYCKFQNECENKHEDRKCSDGSQCKEVKTCPLRHPKMCRRMLMEGFCGRGQKCAYNHKNNDKEKIKLLKEEVKNLNDQMDEMKNSVKSLICLKLEGIKLQKDVVNIKGEIKILLEENKETVLKIKTLEDELHENTVEEADKEATRPLKNNQKEGRNANIFKCEMCEFTTRRNMTFKKHMNTKHPVEPDCKENTTESSDESVNSNEEDSDIDLFSFEVVG